jgi:hypothetical protein
MFAKRRTEIVEGDEVVLVFEFHSALLIVLKVACSLVIGGVACSLWYCGVADMLEILKLAGRRGSNIPCTRAA